MRANSTARRVGGRADGRGQMTTVSYIAYQRNCQDLVTTRSNSTVASHFKSRLQACFCTPPPPSSINNKIILLGQSFAIANKHQRMFLYEYAPLTTQQSLSYWWLSLVEFKRSTFARRHLSFLTKT